MVLEINMNQSRYQKCQKFEQVIAILQLMTIIKNVTDTASEYLVKNYKNKL